MAATPTAISDLADGPVIGVINRRLRALRKKYNRIVQMEESLSLGKPLNKEQEEVLRSKPGVAALIDELEKLRPPLSAAVHEEVSLALSSASQPQQQSLPTEDQENSDTAVSEKEQHSVPEPVSTDEIIEDLLKLIYFGFIFDVKQQSDFTSMMLTRTHERNCCLTYDYVTDDDTDLLGEKDLDTISITSSLLISRPVDSALSHKNALRRCVEHAKLWIANSDQPIEPESIITYAGLRERLDKIMASDYFTTSPEMKAPVEVAAAAAAGNYASFHGAVGPPAQVESPVEHYQEDEATADFQQVHETSDNQSSPMEDIHEADLVMENAIEVTSQQEQAKPSAEGQNQRDVDSKEQQYIPRRNYPNQRGGGRGGGGNASGRRGYPNGRGGRGSGRGGGGYQNGRNQYYEQQQQQQQSGNYYQRNYYNNRGRGGRGGGGGGGHSYNNYGSTVQSTQADVELAS